MSVYVFFFFQAEDGIRDVAVTGVQTCALPIYIVEDLFVASTHSYLLFFTTLGKVHWLKVHEIPEGGRQAKGKAMVNLLALGDNERVATCVPVRAFTTGGDILFPAQQGKGEKNHPQAHPHPPPGRIPAIGRGRGGRG